MELTELEIEEIYQKELDLNKGTSSEVELLYHEELFKDAVRLTVKFINKKQDEKNGTNMEMQR
jgi:hypothetical protein